MSSLKTLLGNREPVATEKNLVNGQVWSWSAGLRSAGGTFGSGFRWEAPAAGTATIEIWGSGGGGGGTCCCGHSISANSGAYAKKVIVVDAGNCVCGNVMAGGTGANCCGSCGCPSCVCWQGTGGSNACIRVAGGADGRGYCATSTSAFCCFAASGSFCNSYTSAGCGLICNWFSGRDPGQVCSNCTLDDCQCSIISCMESFCGAGSHQLCGVRHFQAIPAGMHGKAGGYIVWSPDNGSVTHVGIVGSGFAEAQISLSHLSKFPKGGSPHRACWATQLHLGCATTACTIPYLPVGVGAGPTDPYSSNCQSFGKRGGPGAVRITFIES